MIYTHTLIIAVVPALVTFGAMQQRIDAIQSRHKTALVELQGQYQDAYTKAADTARDQQKTITDKYQEALNDTFRAQTVLLADAGRARTELASLRKQVATAAHRIALPTTAPAAVIEYASASSELLADCGRRYQELGQVADGHAADVRMMQAAWPSSQSQPTP